jgi:phage terminase large subunit GpA-like protein
MIDWTRPQKSRGGTRYPVKCPMCGEERMLRAGDARRAEQNNDSSVIHESHADDLDSSDRDYRSNP